MRRTLYLDNALRKLPLFLQLLDSVDDLLFHLVHAGFVPQVLLNFGNLRGEHYAFIP